MAITIQEQHLIDVCVASGIDNKLELAHILAQCVHETAGFTRFEENLNYSAEALVKIFPKYFNQLTSQKYGRTASQKANQKAIGDIIYGGRMGNDADEGYLYRGRGVIQLTGKYNYQQFTDWVDDVDFVAKPDAVLDDTYCFLTAPFFWLKNNISKHALADDAVMVRKLINGGKIGLEDTTKLTEKYKKILIIT